MTVSFVIFCFVMNEAYNRDIQTDGLRGLEVAIVAILGTVFIYAEFEIWLSVSNIIKAIQSKKAVSIVFNLITIVLAFTAIVFDFLYYTSNAVAKSDLIMIVSCFMLFILRVTYFTVSRLVHKE